MDIRELASAMFVGGWIGFFIAWIGIIIAQVRNPRALVTRKPKNTESFTTHVSQDDAVRRVVRYAMLSHLQIHHLDEHAGVLILASPITLFDCGFFVPIYMSPGDDGTVVEVGVRSRFGALLLVPSAHRHTFNAIRAAVEFGA